MWELVKLQRKAETREKKKWNHDLRCGPLAGIKSMDSKSSQVKFFPEQKSAFFWER